MTSVIARSLIKLRLNCTSPQFCSHTAIIHIKSLTSLRDRRLAHATGQPPFRYNHNLLIWCIFNLILSPTFMFCVLPESTEFRLVPSTSPVPASNSPAASRTVTGLSSSGRSCRLTMTSVSMKSPSRGSRVNRLVGSSGNIVSR
ncbi:hypothetical protein An01g13495 [Aspergillus niger]|uniref:Uncharacterized protein n=2 Tax=Aspergillus niger TaxID=5061 RepID=A2QB11_ASPNC|nr:hypothetical protein An01g13495 [Aspergillus niger]CAK44136.1 hypothetical protein An01g13495 [Aspergillus niger]